MKTRPTVVTVILVLVNLFMSAHANTKQDVYDRAGSSIYELYAIDKDKQTIRALGSSVAVSKHYLATNCHVALAGYFLIANINSKPYLARICYFNKDNDLCIVDVVGVDLNPVEIRPSKDVVVGEDVYAIGNFRNNKLEITQGKVTNLLSDEGYPIIVSNAQTERGSSGGGLFDRNAKLIGITSSGISGTDIGYSISTELILEVIDIKKLPACRLPE